MLIFFFEELLSYENLTLSSIFFYCVYSMGIKWQQIQATVYVVIMSYSLSMFVLYWNKYSMEVPISWPSG